VEKFQAELQKKATGDVDEDEKGFLSKYWMYILPAYLIFTLMSSSGGAAA
jgi:hypothetical protein